MPVTINGSNTPTAGGVTYGDGTTYANTAAGTTGQALVSAGASAPAFGTLGIAGGGTNSTATATAGGIGYGTGTAHAYTTVGTSGQFLTSAGASAPTWTTPSSGALVFISSQTVSTAVAQIDFTSGFSSTYDDYILNCENITGSTAAMMGLRLYKSGAFQTTNYVQQYSQVNGGGYTASSGFTTVAIPLSALEVNDVDKRCGVLNMFNFNSTTASGAQILGTFAVTNGSVAIAQICGSQSTAAAVTGIRIYFMAGGNFVSGTFRLYGVAKA